MMDELWPNRPFLETLTTTELIRLADSQGIDIPPGLDRTIIIEELLETTGDDESSNKKGPLPLAEKRQGATAPLPKQYNISYIEVLIRDPLWAFAFWEINAHDKGVHEKASDFGGYHLRVSPVNIPEPEAPSTGSTAGDSSFTVQVGTEDSAWYLGFPPSGGSFKVELCVIRRDEPIILAVSNSFKLPKLLKPWENKGPATVDNPLLRLSGIDDFKILRNTIRSSRLPKRIGVNAAGVQG
ncbi:DUF4912 domain-containing protein [Treponema primitia]|uniref:DUF4912 domain-containing protein n=1 Tax=Treponema primitia TaxID=88058 RepID=UPI0002F0CFAC|nr:DUF4912 domain-containing protein [Treponema primitia]